MQALLKIIIKPWKGQSEKQPEVTEKVLTFGSGDFIIIQTAAWFPEWTEDKPNFSMRVIEAHEDNITLQTSGLVSTQKNGGAATAVSLENVKVTIPRNETLWLSTPTAEKGMKFAITFLGTQTIKR